MQGRKRYLYRAIDEDGNLVHVRLSEKQDMEAANIFFAQVHEIDRGTISNRCLTSYPRAITKELGLEVEHQVEGCLGNSIEQSHRSIKQCDYLMLCIEAFESAKRFCQTFEELKQLLRPKTRMVEFGSLSKQRAQQNWFHKSP